MSSLSLTPAEITARTQPSAYDNSMVFLHKKAIQLGVPVNYILVQASRDTPGAFLDSFELDENPTAVIRSIFDVVRQIYEQDSSMTLEQIAEILKDIRGDAVNRTELIFIWLKATADLQESEEEVLQQINTYLKQFRGISEYQDIRSVYAAYQDWLRRYETEYTRDVNDLIKFSDVQREIEQIEPIYHSPLVPDSVTVFYEYPTEPGINPLPDLFNDFQNSYIIPFIQYNIKSIKGEAQRKKEEARRKEMEDMFRAQAEEKKKKEEEKKREAEVVNSLFKIYKGESVDSRPKYNNVIAKPTDNKRDQTIYLNVWAGEDVLDDSGRISNQLNQREAQKDRTFYVCSISYLESTHKLQVIVTSPRTDNINEMTLIRRIHQHIPSLAQPNPDQIRIQRISGTFRLYGVDLVDDVLASLIMSDPVFSTYLYLDERSKSFPDRSKFKVNYHSATVETNEVGQGKSQQAKSKTQSAILASLQADFVPPKETFVVEMPNGEQVQRQQEESFEVVDVIIKNAASIKVIRQFMNVISRLFQRYLARGTNIRQDYLDFVPAYQLVLDQLQIDRDKSLTRLISAELPSSIEDISESQKERELRRYAPEVFVKGYPRRCPPIRQPRLIRPEDRPFWESRQIMVNGELKNREIQEFPKDDPRYLLVCPNDEYPLPGYWHNTLLVNKHQYPYIPCCFADEQKRATNYQAYHGERIKAGITKKGAHTMSTDKILEPGRDGYIPPVISSYLKMHRPEVGEFYRYGVPRTTNSLFHCVFRALEIPEYLTEQDEEEREELVANFRSSLFRLEKTIHPELVRQELYDRSNGEIVDLATDNEQFFDPLTLYRLIEEIFGINLYVFSYKEQAADSVDKISLLQLPRHKYFHVHPPSQGRPVVLVIRHLGAKAVLERYPQCELIFEKRGTESTFLFGENMYKRLCSAINFVGRTLTWQILESQVDTPQGRVVNPEMTTRVNMYSMINYPQLFGQIPIIGQYIDQSGKARMLAIVPQWADPDHTEYGSLQIYVTVPPTAPLNVPSFQPEDIADSLPPYQRLIELFGEPISATTSIDQTQLTGLWFPMGDIQFGLYCPCQDFSFGTFLRKYPQINQHSELAALTVHIPRRDRTEKLSSLDRLRVLDRASKFIDQIVKYLYLNSQRNQNLDEFLISIGRFLSVEPVPDSIEIYDPRTISRILPASNQPPGPAAVEDILNQLSQQSPEIFPQGYLVYYDDRMYQGIRYQLYAFIRKIAGLNITAESFREIQNYYQQKDDYNFNPSTQFILGSLKEYNDWAEIYAPKASPQQQINQTLRENIQTTLNPNAYSYSEPYVYQKSQTNIISSNYNPAKDQFYLIQNVVGSEYRRAIQGALNWFNDKKNTGFATEPYRPDSNNVPVHIVYRISSNGDILEKQNLSDGQPQYLEILNYGEDRYAAMLPIL